MPQLHVRIVCPVFVEPPGNPGDKNDVCMRSWPAGWIRR